MDTASQVLLIIVSSVLSIFLVALVVGLVYVIGVLKQVKRLVTRAETMADSVEAAASTFSRAASPLAALKLISNIVEHANSFRRKKG